jgi:hypothetical protein
MWYQFTAPVDDVTAYLGVFVVISAASLVKTTYTGGYEVRIAAEAAGASKFGRGVPVAAGPESGSVTVYVPRNSITWNAVNSIVLHPSWLCARPIFFCDPLNDYSFPVDDGRGASGRYSSFSVTSPTIARFATNTVGMAPWVAGVGNVDGLNAVYTLIGWTGLGPVTYTVNGLLQPMGGAVLGATTVTLDAPPPSGSIVLFNYPVKIEP